MCLLSNTPWPPWQKAAVYEVQRKAAGADCQKLTLKAYSLKGFTQTSSCYDGDAMDIF